MLSNSLSFHPWYCIWHKNMCQRAPPLLKHPKLKHNPAPAVGMLQIRLNQHNLEVPNCSSRVMPEMELHPWHSIIQVPKQKELKEEIREFTADNQDMQTCIKSKLQRKPGYNRDLTKNPQFAWWAGLLYLSSGTFHRSCPCAVVQNGQFTKCCPHRYWGE